MTGQLPEALLPRWLVSYFARLGILHGRNHCKKVKASKGYLTPCQFQLKDLDLIIFCNSGRFIELQCKQGSHLQICCYCLFCIVDNQSFTCKNEVLKSQRKRRNRSIQHDTTRNVCFSWTLLFDAIQNTFHCKSAFVFYGLLRSRRRMLIRGPPMRKVPVCGTKNNIRRMTSQWLNCFHLDLLDHRSDPHRRHYCCHGRNNRPGFQVGFLVSPLSLQKIRVISIVQWVIFFPDYFGWWIGESFLGILTPLSRVGLRIEPSICK